MELLITESMFLDLDKILILDNSSADTNLIETCEFITLSFSLLLLHKVFPALNSIQCLYVTVLAVRKFFKRLI